MNKSDTIKVTSQKSSYSKSIKNTLMDGADSKKHFQNIIKQEMANERLKTQQKVQKQKQEKKQMHKKYLQNQLHKKKKELQQLQRSHTSKQGQEAFYNAQLKSQKIKINRQEKQERAKTLHNIAKDRFQKAVKRLQQQEQQKNQKRTIAQQLRNIHSQKQVLQRKQASEYIQTINTKIISNQQKIINQQKKAVINYQNSVNRNGLNLKILNTVSSPVAFVMTQNQSSSQAMQKANIQQNRIRQQQQKKRQLIHQNRKIAIERAQKVLQQMQRKKEYDAYCQEIEKQQRKYNLNRIQAGKANQFVGIKPLTVSQISENKKIRSERQFQEMFIRVPLTNLNNQVASKYKISEAKMIDNSKQLKLGQKYTKKPIDYIEKQSLIPQVSEGHYSFQEQKSSLNQKNLYKMPQQPSKTPQNHKSITKQKQVSGVTKKDALRQNLGQEAEFVIKNAKNTAELSYSRSQEQDSNI